MDDLKIVVNQELGVISTNFKEVKDNLKSQMEVYKQLGVTEKNKTERKKDLSALRKMVKAVNDKRIEVKKECLKPYQVFEDKANELIQLINEPIHVIDNQVKEFEEKQRLAKQDEIAKAYNELIGDLSDNVSLASIYDSKWENVATSLKSIKEDLKTKIDNIKQSASIINSMVSEKKDEALQMYWSDLNMNKAVSFINHYEQQKIEIQKRMEEQQRREKEREIEAERERIRREERARIAEEERIKAEEKRKAQAEQEAKERTEREILSVKQVTGDTEMITYKIIATKEEFEMVEMYLNSIGLEFLKGDF